MKVKYLGPSDAVNVAPYGPHRKDEEKDYPDEFAEELLATSKKQKFVIIKTGGQKSEVRSQKKKTPEPLNLEPGTVTKKGGK